MKINCWKIPIQTIVASLNTMYTYIFSIPLKYNVNINSNDEMIEINIILTKFGNLDN